MTPQTCDELLALADKLAALLRQAAPVADPVLLTKIRFVCAKLGHTAALRFNAGKLESRAARYLSARKHSTHHYGAEGLMREMESLLDNIRGEIANERKQAP